MPEFRVSEISGTEGRSGPGYQLSGWRPRPAWQWGDGPWDSIRSEFALKGCAENSEEARELAMIAETLGAYECKRWPDGKVQAGRGEPMAWHGNSGREDRVRRIRVCATVGM